LPGDATAEGEAPRGDVFGDVTVLQMSEVTRVRLARTPGIPSRYPLLVALTVHRKSNGIMGHEMGRECRMHGKIRNIRKRVVEETEQSGGVNV
jgi:hypothetical protein